MPVRSRLLVNKELVTAGDNILLYAVPSGRTAIAKDWRISQFGSAAVRVYLATQDLAADQTFFERAVLGTDSLAVGVGFVVVPPELRILCSILAGIGTVDVRIQISGALLLGAPA